MPFSCAAPIAHVTHHALIKRYCLFHTSNLTCQPTESSGVVFPLLQEQRCAGADVQVQLGSLDGRRFTAEEAHKPIWFGEVAVGARQHRVVRVSNTTPLPLPFCWQQTDDPVSSGKLRTLLQAAPCKYLIKKASLYERLLGKPHSLHQTVLAAVHCVEASSTPCCILLSMAVSSQILQLRGCLSQAHNHALWCHTPTILCIVSSMVSLRFCSVSP